MKMWRRSLNDSVTVNVINSDVLLLEGPWNYMFSDGGRQPNRPIQMILRVLDDEILRTTEHEIFQKSLFFFFF